VKPSIVMFGGRQLLVRSPTRAEEVLGADAVYERDGQLVFSLKLGAELRCTCRDGAACQHRRDVRDYRSTRKLSEGDLPPRTGVGV
jgi:hypothetical protein